MNEPRNKQSAVRRAATGPRGTLFNLSFVIAFAASVATFLLLPLLVYFFLAGQEHVSWWRAYLLLSPIPSVLFMLWLNRLIRGRLLAPYVQPSAQDSSSTNK